MGLLSIAVECTMQRLRTSGASILGSFSALNVRRKAQNSWAAVHDTFLSTKVLSSLPFFSWRRWQPHRGVGLYAVGASRASAAGAGQAVEGPRGSLAGWWAVSCVLLVRFLCDRFKVADYYDLVPFIHPGTWLSSQTYISDHMVSIHSVQVDLTLADTPS